MAAGAEWRADVLDVNQSVMLTVVYYHDKAAIRMDADNILKPFQDALIGLIYQDDRSVTDALLRKTPLDRPINARGISRVLAEGFVSGREFLYVRVEHAPSHEAPL